MQQAIADVLLLQTTAISIKATTTEKLGFIGREEGLSAYATILITWLNAGSNIQPVELLIIIL